MESVTANAPREGAHGATKVTGEGYLGFVASREPGRAADRVLVVTVGRVLPAHRGRLAEVVGEAIDRELHALGAAPPGIGASRDGDSALSDQLFRGRQLGVTRFEVRLPSLRPVALEGALGPEDSRALLFWAQATSERPVDLTLDPLDDQLGAHVDPIPLRAAFDRVVHPPVVTPEPQPAPVVAPPPAPEPPAPVVQLAVPVPLQDLEAENAAAEVWRTPTLALAAARGPQPLAMLERLFTTSYVPLDRAIHESHGAIDPRAVRARDEFRANFSKVYSEAFPQFALTGKRPKMVFDAPDAAAKIARHTSARSSQLLLVDSMRYDLGALVKTELALALTDKATLTHELILWSALPTTTPRQLATLSRGAAALQAEVDPEAEDAAFRGRTAQTIRRVKIGSRDVFKLDVCDVRLRDAGDRVMPLLPKIASEAALVIMKHVSTLAPRTLLFVFGDHGFTLGQDGAPTHGGPSPEEVLVPAFAFLIGEPH